MFCRAAFLTCLALAAVASAQTVTLSPVATRGYIETFKRNYPIQRAFMDGLKTSGDYVLMPVLQKVMSSFQQGWRAEFDLSAIPTGSQIISATLTTSIVGATSPYIVPIFCVEAYRGTGTIPLSASGPFVTSSLRAQLGTVVNLNVAPYLGATGRYVGFQFSTERSFGNTHVWAAPTLTVIYAPSSAP